MDHYSHFSLDQKDLDFVQKYAADDLAQLHGAHIFMTGCTAFFGKWLIESLLWANQILDLRLKLTVLSRNPSAFLNDMPHLAKHSAASFLMGDITDFCLNEPFSHVIHAANLPNDGSTQWPLRHMDAAIHGTRRILEAAARTNCASALFVSSGGAYRAEPCISNKSINQIALKELQDSAEDNLCEPNIYGLTKRFTEAYITSLGTTYGIRTPLARCFAFAGPHMPLDSPRALCTFFRNALQGKEIVIKGDGTAMRSYMYGADLVVWLLAVLLRGRHGVPYNIGSEEAISVSETAERLVKYAPNNVTIKILGEKTKGNAPEYYIPDTSRSREELHLKCLFTFDNIISNSFAWYRNCGSRFQKR